MSQENLPPEVIYTTGRTGYSLLVASYVEPVDRTARVKWEGGALLEQEVQPTDAVMSDYIGREISTKVRERLSGDHPEIAAHFDGGLLQLAGVKDRTESDHLFHPLNKEDGQESGVLSRLAIVAAFTGSPHAENVKRHAPVFSHNLGLRGQVAPAPDEPLPPDCWMATLGDVTIFDPSKVLYAKPPYWHTFCSMAVGTLSVAGNELA